MIIVLAHQIRCYKINNKYGYNRYIIHKHLARTLYGILIKSLIKNYFETDINFILVDCRIIK